MKSKVVLLCTLSLAMAVLPAWAAPKAKKGAAKAQPVEEPAVAQVTHEELAQLLVRILGLARFLPAAPTDLQCFAILMDNGIAPFGGWQVGKVVTKADLARVIVQALKKQGDIENPDDPKAWIDYVKSLGIPLESVGEAVAYLDPLVEPVAANVVSATRDPLVRRQRFNPLDETQYGVDMEYVVRVFSQLEFDQGEFRPITPD